MGWIPNAAISFWNSHLHAVDRLIGDSEMAENAWMSQNSRRNGPSRWSVTGYIYDSPGPELRPTRWHMAPEIHFWMLHGGESWGNGRFPPPSKENTKNPEPVDGIFRTAVARFRDRENNSGNRNSEALWTEALGQKEKGWPTPFTLSDEGEPSTLCDKAIDVDLRLGGQKSDKMRARDDVRHSRANLA